MKSKNNTKNKNITTYKNKKIGGTKIEKIKIEDADYPERLKEIENPPKQLYIEGNKQLLQTNTLSIIGSRICTTEGIERTEKFVKKLVEKNITIASGLAKRNRHCST